MKKIVVLCVLVLSLFLIVGCQSEKIEEVPSAPIEQAPVEEIIPPVIEDPVIEEPELDMGTPSMSPCQYYTKVQDYNGITHKVASSVAYDYFYAINQDIKFNEIEVDTTPFVSFKTDPPTPSTGTITLLTFSERDMNKDIEYQTMNVDVEDLVKAQVSIDFINRENPKECATYNDPSFDKTCFGPLYFYEGEVFKEFANLC